MKDTYRSPNFDDRRPDGLIDMLVLHYTGMQTAEEALQRLCDDQAKVSAHYLVDEDGTCYALVAEEHRAWHAGVASWRGNTDINARSIGIEIVNPGHEFGYRPFPIVQMETVRDLALDILRRHPIPPRNVVGHSDVAPTRKQDPGELFDWPGLAESGIGLWSDNDAVKVDVLEVLPWLERLGYDTADDEAALLAFQRHFLPNNMTGVADGPTRVRLAAIVEIAETDAG